jgi:hypothetical protein
MPNYMLEYWSTREVACKHMYFLLIVHTTLFLAFSVVLHLMLLLLILPATLYTNHLKHVETSYIVLRLTFSVCNIS